MTSVPFYAKGKLLFLVCLVIVVSNSAFAQSTPTSPPKFSSATSPQSLSLDDLVRIALDQNPALRQASFAIEASQGKAVQAGLYPNPTVSVGGEEIGPRAGIQTLPQVSQEIVTGGKLRLERAVAEREVDQAFLKLQRQRYALLTAIRQGYFEVLAAQRRVEVLKELVELSGQAFANTKKLVDAKQLAELDALQFEVELDRLRADHEAAERELAAAWRRLVAAVGVPQLAQQMLHGSIEADLPRYDFERVRAQMLDAHPEIRAAMVGITRAEAALRLEKANSIPNVTVTAGYQRNFNDRENQFMYQVGVPLPLFNRNQGHIISAQAELGRAIQEVTRVENDLISRLSSAFGQYSAAQRRVERYRTSILPKSRDAYRISLAAFRGGQFEYLRVLQAQRAVQEANLVYLNALADAWRAASEISGMLLEDQWPTPQVPSTK